MDFKSTQNLVTKSYTNDSLDEKKVKEIANNLSRKNLKKYINSLRKRENKSNVIIYTPFGQNDRETFNNLKNTFNSKKITVNSDPSLMLGIQVINDDFILEYSLRNILANIKTHVSQNYDKKR